MLVRALINSATMLRQETLKYDGGVYVVLTNKRNQQIEMNPEFPCVNKQLNGEWYHVYMVA